MSDVRTRFAPSPTGYMHIGGMRTALFNWLWARHSHGKFILRIDDTDRQRNVDEALRPILAAFRWLGLNWDEGAEIGGPYAPYFQSQRTEIYKQAAQRLLDEKQAYRDFEKPEDVQREREAAEREKRPFTSSRRSLELSAAEVSRLVAAGQPHVIRFLVPRGQTLPLDDVVRGHVEWDTSLLPDPVIMRPDGTPLYNFATVVDDAGMSISHVIRAEEHLSNTPIQIMLHHALGNTLPIFAHIPFVTAPGTTKKLSKRDLKKYRDNPKFKKMFDAADQVFPQIGLGSSETLNPVMVEYYEKIGFLPEAVLNALARLGWSLDDRTEFMSLPTIVENFTLDRIVKNPAGLDPDKLYSFQTHWMSQVSLENRVAGCLPYLIKAGLVADPPDEATRNYVRRVVRIAGERLKVFSDILNYRFAFVRDEDLEYDSAAIAKRLGDEKSILLLRKFRTQLARLRAWDLLAIRGAVQEVIRGATSVALEPSIASQLADILQADALESAANATEHDIQWFEGIVVNSFVESEGVKLADIIHAIRIAITGTSTGPSLLECLKILEQHRSVKRISLLLHQIAPSPLEHHWQLAFGSHPTPTPATYELPQGDGRLSLFDGEVILRFEEKEFRGAGNLFFQWIPSPATRFEFTNSKTEGSFLPDFPLGTAQLQIPAWNAQTDAIVTGANFGSHVLPSVRGVLNGTLVHAQGDRVSKVRFLVTNFHNVLGSSLSDGTQAWIGRSKLEAGPWRVIIDSFAEGKTRMRDAASNGGYVLSHCGQLERGDESEFPTSDISDMMHTLQSFLSFARGFWVAPWLAVGYDKNDFPIWHEFGIRKFDRNSSAESWFPVMERGALESAFEKFFRLWADPSTRRFLYASVYWYLDANSPTGATEGRIVSAIVAVEAIRSLMEATAGDKEKRPSRSEGQARLCEVVQSVGVSDDIPERFAELRQFANSVGAKSGPQAIYALRNAIVHPDLNNLAILDGARQINEMYWQAWYLALWYAELGLLYAIGYSGKYLRRTRSSKWESDSENVPWATDENSLKLVERA